MTGPLKFVIAGGAAAFCCGKTDEYKDVDLFTIVNVESKAFEKPFISMADVREMAKPYRKLCLEYLLSIGIKKKQIDMFYMYDLPKLVFKVYLRGTQITCLDLVINFRPMQHQNLQNDQFALLREVVKDFDLETVKAGIIWLKGDLLLAIHLGKNEEWIEDSKEIIGTRTEKMDILARKIIRSFRSNEPSKYKNTYLESAIKKYLANKSQGDLTIESLLHSENVHSLSEKMEHILLRYQKYYVRTHPEMRAEKGYPGWQYWSNRTHLVPFPGPYKVIPSADVNDVAVIRTLLQI